MDEDELARAVSEDAAGVILVRVRVRPRARRTAVEGLHDGAVRIHLQAPPVDGAANEALVAFVARELLGVRTAQVRLVRGASSRDKVLAVEGVTVEAVRRALRER